MRVLEFPASVIHEGKWYVGAIDEIPGVHSQGRTLKELEENLKDALVLVMQTRRDLAMRNRSGKQHHSLSVAVEVA